MCKTKGKIVLYCCFLINLKGGKPLETQMMFADDITAKISS